MAYELFDPASPCNPILPLNKISNSLTFFKINVFEVTLDKFVRQNDGKIDGATSSGSMIPEKIKLGIPLTDMFPEIRNQLKTKLFKGTNPIKVGIEGVFLHSNKDYPKSIEVKDVFLFNDDIKSGKLKAGTININVEEILSDLKRNGVVLYKHKDKLYRILKPESSIDVDTLPDKSNTLKLLNYGDIKLSTDQIKDFKEKGNVIFTHRGNTLSLKRSESMKSNEGPRPIFFDFTPNMSFLDPSTLNEERYFEILAALLFDPRSGMSEKGIQHSFFNPSALDDSQYSLIFINFKKDSRYSKYFSKFSSSSNLPGGKASFPSYEIGLYTSFDQNWELQGYSRGSLLNSITLAPREDISIEVFTFDRLKVEQEKEFTTEFEKNLEISSLSRASSEIAKDLTSTTDSNADVGLGIPLPIEGVPVNLDVSGGVSNQVKEGIQSTLNQINESTVNTSEKFKSKTKITVLQSRESGEEKRTIRKISNPNNSRTLTLNYFEIQETFKVTTKLKKDKKFCVLVDNPDFGAFDIDFILAYENRLQKSLLSSNYINGFEGAKKLAAQRWFDKKSEIKVEIENSDGSKSSSNDAVKKPIIRTALNLKSKLKQFLDADLLKAAETLSAHYDPTKPDNQKPSRKKVSDAEDALGLFNYWAKMKMASPGIESKAIEFVEKVGNNASEEAIIEQLELFLSGMDDEWLTGLKMLGINLVSVQLASVLAIPFPILIPLFFEFALFNNDNGLPKLIDKGKADLKSHDMTQSVALPQTTTSEAGAAANIQIPQPPPQLFSLEELALANAEFEKLVLHLEANKTYYINKILLYEDSSDRFLRLKMKGISNYIENRILGFIGNKTAFPLRIEVLDSYTRDKLEKEIAKFDTAKDETINGVATKKIEPKEEIISLPTNGIYVESLLGQCEALEPYLLERQQIEKQMAQAQADIATERVLQQKEETKRLAERVKQGKLENPSN